MKKRKTIMYLVVISLVYILCLNSFEIKSVKAADPITTPGTAGKVTGLNFLTLTDVDLEDGDYYVNLKQPKAGTSEGHIYYSENMSLEVQYGSDDTDDSYLNNMFYFFAENGGQYSIYLHLLGTSNVGEEVDLEIVIIVDVKGSAPVITSGATASFSENGTGTAYTATGTVSAGKTITWSIKGTDSGLFNMNISTGALIFKNPPNYENPTDSGGDNTYNLTITATDGSLSTDKEIAITVTDVNEDITAPTVTGVTPSSTDASLSGNVVITFDEAMSTTVGTVQLNSLAVLTGGSWSNGNKTYTIAYSGLVYNTAYTVSISGFKDVAGNTMTANTSNSFSTIADTFAPSVTGVSPANSATDVALSGTIVITFNEAMKTTVGTVKLNDLITLVGGTWSNGNKTYTVAYTGLDYHTSYTIKMTGFADTVGNVTTENTGNSFTTVPDTTAPNITVVSPVDSATNIAISGNVVITFNEAMKTTVGTVQLNDLTALTGGSWSNGNKTYTIAYTGLENSKNYTIKMTGFEDVTGNVMTTNTSNSFVTVAETTAPTVTGVTPSGTNAALSGTVVITFDEAMNTTAGTVQLNSLTALTGGSWSNGNKTYTIAYSGLGYSTSYTVNISGFKDVAGNTMTANASNHFITIADTFAPSVTSVSPVNSATDVALNGTIVITFDEAMKTTVGTVQLNTLTALTQGTWSNGNKTYTVAYTGLDYHTSYTIKMTGFADTVGNVMTENTGNSFTTVPDTTAPNVTVVSPVDSATNIAISGNVVITFNEAMKTTVGTVQLNDLTALTGGSWSNGNKTYTVAYTGLENSKNYTIKMTGFEDVTGNVMTTNTSNSFVTVAETTAPTVTGVTPSSTDAALSGTVVITFDEAMNTTVGTVQLNSLTALTGGTWSNGNKTYTIAYSGLVYNTAYTVSISGFKDVAGNTMTANTSNSFITIADTFAPSVTSVSPANSATNVTLSGTIEITFDEAMNTTVGTVQLNSLTAFTGGSWSNGNKTYTIAYSGLVYNTTYTVSISGFKDVAENAMTANASNSFITIADTFAPSVTGVSPDNNATDVALSGTIVITFNEAMNASVGAVKLNDLSVLTGGNWSNGNKTYTVTYTGLEYSKNYTIKITGFEDAVGNLITANTSNSFTTRKSAPITDPPSNQPPVTPVTPKITPGVEQITVEVKQGSTDNTVSQIAIERTTDIEGKKTDKVTYDDEKAIETINKLKEEGKDLARIVIPDVKDEVSETTVNIPSSSLDTLAKGEISLQIDTEEAKIDIPKETLSNANEGMSEDLYFNLVPIKKEDKRNEVEKRAIFEVEVLKGNSESGVTVVGNPITVETNMPSGDVDITLPLTGIKIPTNPIERDIFLKQLSVYIEHSDGDKELVQGEIVEYKKGIYGIKFHITKFSIFTIVKTDVISKSSSCDIKKVITPVKSSISGTRITASVANKMDYLTIKVTTSSKASWKLYSDKACKKELTNHKLMLRTGMNKVYIKVTAEDGKTCKVYTFNITRQTETKKVIIVATKYDFADAFASGVLAEQLGGEIVQTGITANDGKKMVSYIKKNYSKQDVIYIIGLGQAVNQNLEKLLKKEGYTRIIRIGGEDKYETAKKIADKIKISEKAKVVLVNGEIKPKDASRIQKVCATKGYPILFVEADSLTNSTVEALTKLKPTKIYIIGDNTQINDKVLTDLMKKTGIKKSNIKRVESGTDIK